jgi:hypothetical protein
MKIKKINKKKFDELSKPEQRVEICKDVIARIKAKLVVPTYGSFWDSVVQGAPENSLQTQINNSTCSVCAKGALFCGWVGNFNKVTVEEFNEGCFLENVEELKRVSPELVKLFGEKMLDNIEAAFEGEPYSWHYNVEETEKYAKAFENYELIDIMEYIVKNKGAFPLPKKKDNKKKK